ncbi:MAG: Hpt domain-containing protein [Faecalibacterium sp.]
MTIQECYQAIGSDFLQIKKRFPTVGMIRRFIAKFLEDDTFSELCRAMEDGNRKDAFRCAHTLKGVCANLGLGRLQASVSKLTEELRTEADQIPADAEQLLEEVKADYALTVQAIREYLDSAE